jgi:hypothetical protein
VVPKQGENSPNGNPEKAAIAEAVDASLNVELFIVESWLSTFPFSVYRPDNKTCIRKQFEFFF